jgi:hypothetical protein
VAQLVSRGGPGTTSTTAISVADLLSRNAPVPVKIEVDDPTAGVSVGTLLRREGRAPHALVRPIQARARQQTDEPADESTPQSVLVRRSAFAAGTLLAAGSVIGAAVLTDITPSGVDAQGGTGDTYPGQGLLDQGGEVSANPPGAAVIGPAAVSQQLDAGIPAPTEWMNVAFTGALAGAQAGADAGAQNAAGDAGTTGSDGAGGGGTPTGGDGGAGGNEPANGGDMSIAGAEDGGGIAGPPAGGRSQPDSGSSDHGDSADDRGPVGGLAGGVSDTLGDVGDAAPPLKGATDSLGDTVDGAGNTLDTVLFGAQSEPQSSTRSSAPQPTAAEDEDLSEGSARSADSSREDDSSREEDTDGGGLVGAVGDTVGSLAGGLLG